MGLSEFDKIKNLALHIADQHEKRIEDAGARSAPRHNKTTHPRPMVYRPCHLYDYELQKDEFDACGTMEGNLQSRDKQRI